MRLTILGLLLVGCGGAPEPASVTLAATPSAASSIARAEPSASASAKPVDLAPLIAAAQKKVEALPEVVWLSGVTGVHHSILSATESLPGCTERPAECSMRVALAPEPATGDAPYFLFDVAADGRIRVLTARPGEDGKAPSIAYAEFHAQEAIREADIDATKEKVRQLILAQPEMKRHVAELAKKNAVLVMAMLMPPPFLGCDARSIAAAEAEAKAHPPPIGSSYVSPTAACLSTYSLGDMTKNGGSLWIIVHADERGPVFAESDNIDIKYAGWSQPWAVIRPLLQ